MSEATEIKPLHVGAFILAMIGGPLLITALTFWLAFIPVYAVVFGGIPYLVVGTPMALWMALTGPVTVERSIAWAGMTIVAITLLFAVAVSLTGDDGGWQFVLIVGVISAVFGMAWSAASGWLYGAMTHEKAV